MSFKEEYDRLKTEGRDKPEVYGNVEPAMSITLRGVTITMSFGPEYVGANGPEDYLCQECERPMKVIFLDPLWEELMGDDSKLNICMECWANRLYVLQAELVSHKPLAWE